MTCRFGNIYYLLRRPDLFHQKAFSLKMAVFGAVAVPMVLVAPAFVGAKAWREGRVCLWESASDGDHAISSDGHQVHASADVGARPRVDRATLSADAWREYNHTKALLQDGKMSLKLVFAPLRELLADTNLAQFSQFVSGTGGGLPRF